MNMGNRFSRRLFASLLSGALVSLSALPAQAQLFADQHKSTWHRHAADTSTHSKQTMALEVRFGPYRPKVDEEFGGKAHPFEDAFGNDTRIFLGLELDYQLLRIPYLGTLGPGFGWAYTEMSAKAKLSNTGAESAEETSLWIMPMYVAGVLRADVFAREFGIPLVPYVKAGLGYGLWKSSDGSGTSVYRRGNKEIEAKGHSIGPHLAGGLMVLLDPFDPHAAQQLDNSVGVNHSYAFAEWMWSDLGSFGNDQMRIGTSTWVMGLAFEM